MARRSAPAPLNLINTSNIALLDKNSRINSVSSSSSFSSIDFPNHHRYSFSSTFSGTSSPRRRKNVYTTCGRHTDQFLFSGPSLTGLAKALFSRH